MISEKNGLAMSGTVTRSFRVLNVRRLFAEALGEYPSLCTAESTRRRVPSETISGELRTRDTVAVETPARAATSRIVVILGPLMSASPAAWFSRAQTGRDGRVYALRPSWELRAARAAHHGPSFIQGERVNHVACCDDYVLAIIQGV